MEQPTSLFRSNAEKDEAWADPANAEAFFVAKAKGAGVMWQPIETAPKDGTNIIATKFGWVVDDLSDWTLTYHGPWWISKAHWHSESQCWSDGFERLCIAALKARQT